MSLLARVDAINVYKKGNNRAPHKPLYLLFLLSAVQKGRSRLIDYSEIDETLGTALRLFGPRTASVHPEYPFWWLQQDGLSEVVPGSASAYELRKNRNDPKRKSLLSVGATGGLLETDYHTLIQNPQLLAFLCHRLLDSHFPVSLHEDISVLFGLDFGRVSDDADSRDDPFGGRVLEGYGFTCAITGFVGSPEVAFAGIEPAEIVWRNHGGSSDPSNGIAMTTIHRKLFHLGLFTISADYRIVLSPVLIDGVPIGLREGNPINPPKDLERLPSVGGLAWHRRWVFRG